MDTDVAKLLPASAKITVDSLRIEPTFVELRIRGGSATACCTCCGTRSTRVHSRYERIICDLPWRGTPMRIRFIARRFFCDCADCGRKLFAEQIDELVERRGRATRRFATRNRASKGLVCEPRKRGIVDGMRKAGGLIHGCAGSKRTSAIEAAIASDDRFTDTIASADVSVSSPELIFVSLEGDRIDYVGVVQPGRKVATGQKAVSISLLEPLGIDLAALLADMPERFASRIGVGISGIERLPPKTWQALLGAVTARGAMAAKAVAATIQRIQSLSRSRRRSHGDFELFEHDAVAVAVEAWGGTRERKRRLRAAAAPLDETAPFLSRLGEVQLREDPQINHDAQTLPGMAVARRFQTGIAVLENARERLTIINCNRQKLEETLGVDLVYYNHAFKSFVLVQYKRMRRDARGNAAYRPNSDGSYESELERMAEVSNELRGIKCKLRNKVVGFRLASAPFFLKVCGDRAGRATEEGMASGMYVPLRLWRSMMKSKQTEGPKGGRVVTWDNCARRFNNREFTSLLRHGWIGSTPTQSEKLSDIIEKALAEKRMVVYAATSASGSRDDYSRDDYGRFASDDDPLASR